jgi:hypothetical protein
LRTPESTQERIDFVASIAQAREIRPLGDLPLQALTAGTFLNQPLLPPQARSSMQERWQDLQTEFLRFSSRAAQSFVLESGHFVQKDAPHAISAAILSMVGHVVKCVHQAWLALHAGLHVVELATGAPSKEHFWSDAPGGLGIPLLAWVGLAISYQNSRAKVEIRTVRTLLDQPDDSSRAARLRSLANLCFRRAAKVIATIDQQIASSAL